MKLEFQHQNLANGSPIVIIEILGTVTGRFVHELENEILQILEQGIQYFIINFSKCPYCESAAFAILANIAANLQQSGEVVLTAESNRIIELFKMLEFTACKTDQEALAMISAKII